MGKKHLSLHLYTNRNCNLYCVHCYNDSFYQDNPKEIVPEQLVEIINKLNKLYDIDIHLEGGEIFLRKEMFRELAKLDLEILRKITITSNGTIFDDTEDILYVLKNVETFRISVEGHDNKANRLLRNVDSDLLFENICAYQDKGVNVVVRTTLHKGNYKTIFEKLIPLLIEKGIKNIQIYELQAVGRGERIQHLLLSNDEFESFLKIISNYDNSRIGIKMFFNCRRRESVYNSEGFLNKMNYNIIEMAPENSLSISSEGFVKICPWENDDNAVFNIFKVKDICSEIKKYNLMHECEYCSRIKIVNGNV